MPTPLMCTTDPGRLAAAVGHLVNEYGREWTGTRALEVGAVLHHGDVPQESREVLEDLVRDGVAPIALCTNTLAEGVNLPLRTLVLYSVRRLGPDGRPQPLRARDIKNLVGRAGRPGSETKGLVICANHGQWPLVAPVAKSEPGERVVGALLELMQRLRRALRQQSLPLTNQLLEINSPLHTLVDGIDATLVELASEEIGETELARLATGLARETFAAQQATTAASVELMETVFSLRARRIAEVRDAGRLGWIRDTGAQVRILDSVEEDLLPARQSWEDIEAPDDPSLIDALVKWSWNLPSVRTATNELYRASDLTPEDFARIVTLWIRGKPLVSIAAQTGLDIDAMLGVHSRLLSYEFQVAVEQGLALLGRLLEADGAGLAVAAADFPEYLRFGVPTHAARILAEGGVRHRRAAVELGRHPEVVDRAPDHDLVFAAANALLEDRETWLRVLGGLVLENTTADLESALRQAEPPREAQ